MKRIQRQRQKGYNSPPNTKYVGRTVAKFDFGNPIKIVPLKTPDGMTEYQLKVEGVGLEIAAYATKAQSNAGATGFYREWLKHNAINGRRYSGLDQRRLWILDHISELREFDYLSCYCALALDCHVDVLLELLER